MALCALVAATAVPQVLAGVDDARARGAARYLASRFAWARAQAVAGGAGIGLRFATAAEGLTLDAFADGDDDGIRATDIASGVDPLIDHPVRLEELFPGTAWSLTLGASDLMAFTPTGTASSGTVAIAGRNGSRYAVRVLGATARTRVLRWDQRRRDFVEIF